MLETLFFVIVSMVANVSAILVVTCRNPINSALSLILTFFCLATYYVMLDAPFLAAVQVMVYAGAIMVLIVFTIMLLNIRVNASKSQSHKVLLGSVIGFFTLPMASSIYFSSTRPSFKVIFTRTRCAGISASTMVEILARNPITSGSRTNASLNCFSPAAPLTNAAAAA